MTYFVTGATGFIGRHLLERLLLREGQILALCRPASRPRLDQLGEVLGARGRLVAIEGDITRPLLGLSSEDQARLRGAEFFHLAAVYDMEADEEANQLANVTGTANLLELARATRAARIHHVSSIAVAGESWKGDFTEEMFSEGQRLQHPYYRTKYEAEKLVRESAAIPFRIYRPGIVIGDSRTGEADRIDGPYYAFKLVQRLRGSLPEWWPMIGLDGGPLNLVPVDFVAAALDHIAHRGEGDGETFHLVDPAPLSLGDTVNEFCRAAHAPEFTLRFDRRALNMVPSGMRETMNRWPAFQAIRDQFLEGIHVPEAVLSYVSNRATFPCPRAQAALAGSGIACPPLHAYAWKIWDHWERQLDPHLPNDRNLQRVLSERVVIVTGASSGIGRAVALRLARHGATVVLVSRQREKLEEVEREIVAAGGKAFVRPTDCSELDEIDAMAREVLEKFGRVDILINNAGRSIRRAVVHQHDRFHDFTRTMQLNYFGAIRLIMAVLPGMQERGTGQVINISSIGVQAYPPRFAAYVASKAALSAFSRCLSAEVAHSGVAITNIHMPLVRTPMIAPTTMYNFFPVSDTDEATDLVVEAILRRPPEMGTRLGKLGQTVDNLAPGFLQLVMTGAYHIFPEGGKLEQSGGSGTGNGSGAGHEEPSPEAMALAHLMKGIHF